MISTPQRRRRRAMVSPAIYLALAALAIVFPLRRAIVWFWEHGLDFRALWAAVSVNEASLTLAGSHFIVTVAVSAFIVIECIARRDWWGFAFVPLTGMMGVAAGLPLYLLFRQRPIE